MSTQNPAIYRIARTSLRLLVESLLQGGKLDIRVGQDALEMIDLLYEPMQQAEQYLGQPPSSQGSVRPQPMSRPQSWPAGQEPPEVRAQLAGPAVTAENIPLFPVKQAGPYDLMDPSWRPIMHVMGENPCGKPAYFIVNKLHPRKRAQLENMRLIHTGEAPRVGIDPAVCGSCDAEIEMWTVRDLDFRPHFMSEEELQYVEWQERQQNRAGALEQVIPQEVPAPTPEPDWRYNQVDPKLEQQNAQSRRWEVAPDDPAIDQMIGIARTMQSIDDLTLPPDADAGLPPGAPEPRLPDPPQDFIDSLGDVNFDLAEEDNGDENNLSASMDLGTTLEVLVPEEETSLPEPQQPKAKRKKKPAKRKR